MLATSLAYKYVTLAVMLMEINYCASKLHLNARLPIKTEDVTVASIDNPKDLAGFGGHIDTQNYFFSFLHSGRLRFICELDASSRQSLGIYRRDDETRVQCMEELSHMRSMISSNDAYCLATNWLISIDIDLKKLEAEKPPVVIQQFLRSGTNLVPVPLFYVKWGGDYDPAVAVMISGVNGELLNVRQEDDSYSKRPAVLIKNIDALLAIPNDEFLKYSPTECSNLVTRFNEVLAECNNSTDCVPLWLKCIAPAPIKSHKKCLHKIEQRYNFIACCNPCSLISGCSVVAMG